MAGVEIKGISQTYHINGSVINALSNINLTIQDGSFVTLVGRSGSGKTTLLKLICRLEKLSWGEINFTGDGTTNHQQQRVSIVFQEPRLMPWLTVEQNMSFSLIKEKNKAEVKHVVDHYLGLLGLTKFKDAYPNQISGGMAQRVALGRTLCYDPDVILMDEPLGALDAFTRKNLQNELVDIFLQHKKTVIFVTHDVDEAVFLGQRVVVFEGGQIIGDIPIELPYPRQTTSRDFYAMREKILSLIYGQ